MKYAYFFIVNMLRRRVFAAFAVGNKRQPINSNCAKELNVLQSIKMMNSGPLPSICNRNVRNDLVSPSATLLGLSIAFVDVIYS